MTSFGLDWLILEPVNPNVWLVFKVISNTSAVCEQAIRLCSHRVKENVKANAKVTSLTDGYHCFLCNYSHQAMSKIKEKICIRLRMVLTKHKGSLLLATVVGSPPVTGKGFPTLPSSSVGFSLWSTLSRDIYNYFSGVLSQGSNGSVFTFEAFKNGD